MKMIPDMTDEDKREFVQAWLGGRVFSSCHLARDRQEHMLGHVFYPVLFGAVGPRLIEIPECPEECPEDLTAEEWDDMRNGGHDRLVERINQVNDKAHETFKAQLGLIWEFYSESLPRSINGYPIFMSCRVMNRTDWDHIWPILEREEKRLASIEV